MELFGIAIETLGFAGAVIVLLIMAGKALYDMSKKNQEQLENITNKHFEQSSELVSSFKAEMDETRKGFRTEMDETRKEFRKEISETRKEHKEDRIAFQNSINDLGVKIQSVEQKIDKIKK